MSQNGQTDFKNLAKTVFIGLFISVIAKKL